MEVQQADPVGVQHDSRHRRAGPGRLLGVGVTLLATVIPSLRELIFGSHTVDDGDFDGAAKEQDFRRRTRGVDRHGDGRTTSQTGHLVAVRERRQYEFGAVPVEEHGNGPRCAVSGQIRDSGEFGRVEQAAREWVVQELEVALWKVMILY